MYSAIEIHKNLLSDFAEVKQYNAEMDKVLINLAEKTPLSAEVNNLVQNKPKRVGYIIATCCPVTKAHMELAKQSIEALNLDQLIFIIWPFHYIPGFHSQPLDSWVKENAYLPWEQRMEILNSAIDEVGDERIVALQASRDWYIESETMFNPEEGKSAFWTGTWYVIRKLQYYFQKSAAHNTEFFFCCGEDQFNPNIYSLLSVGKAGAAEKVWKDYSITQHLAIHNVYAVPRGEEETIEWMRAPTWSPHKIIIGNQLKHGRISATQIRKAKNLATLQQYCHRSVAAHILRKGYWATSKSLAIRSPDSTAASSVPT